MNFLGAPASRWRVALHGKHQLAGETPALPGSWAMSRSDGATEKKAATGTNTAAARGHARTRGRRKNRLAGRRDFLNNADHVSPTASGTKVAPVFPQQPALAPRGILPVLHSGIRRGDFLGADQSAVRQPALASRE